MDVKPLSLMLCFTVLGVVAAGLWSAGDRTSQPTDAATSVYVTGDQAADSAWAAGLLAAVNRSGTRDASTSDRQFLLDALEAATKKAPVYLTIALYDSGPWGAFDSLPMLRRELDRQAGVLSPRLAEVAAQAAPQDRLTQQLLVSLRPRLEEFRASPEPEGEALRTAERFTQDGDCRLLCLEAALAEDPQCTAAWLALALYADAPRQMTALATWQTIDPQNAAPWYLEAVAQQSSGNAKVALAALVAGAERPGCEFPTPALPTRFQVRYADDPALGATAGQRLTPVALANLVHLQSEASPAPNPAAQLHQLALALAESASHAAHHAEVPRLSAAMRRLGAHLLTGHHPTATQVRHGMAILQLSAGIESAASGKPALSGYDFHLQRSTRELSAGLARWNERARELLQDRDAILRGEVDLRGEELSAMRKLVAAPPLQPVLAEQTGVRR